MRRKWFIITYKSTLYPEISGYQSGGLRSDIHNFHVLVNVNELPNCGNYFAVISMETFCVTLI